MTRCFAGRRPGVRVALVGAVIALVATACDYVYAPFLVRLDQPVVIEGSDVPQALGLDPSRALGFRFDSKTSSWVQIPVQIDERVLVDFGDAPASDSTAGTDGTVYGTSPIGVTALQYADPETFVGADTDPTIDANDELVFMARDAGAKAPAGHAAPPGTVSGTGVEVKLADVDGGTPGYVYLYYGTAGADPSAGADYVDYDFTLASGDYKTTYQRADGPNPETSTATSYAYEIDMVDRWKTVGFSLSGGSGADILDGWKSRFSWSTCGRSNETFAAAEGAFAANIDGPVRAIRSYVGANSGPITQETIYFYADRVEFVVDLRVHAISSVMSFFDFAPAADGMLYGNSELASPVVVDGAPDVVPTAIPEWEYVAGPQGAVTWVSELTTSINGLPVDLSYVDDATPSFSECWGSDGIRGAAAHFVQGGIPNTDPRLGDHETLQARRIVGFWPSNLNAKSWSQAWAPNAAEPLDATLSTYG